MKMVRWIVAGLVTAALTLALAGLSRMPIQGLNADQSALRFTWRLRGEEVTSCRAPTEEELAELPVHMRNPDACVGDIPPFRLTVSLDGEERAARLVRPAGVRSDRPLYVYEELLVEPGRHDLLVRFERLNETEPAGAPAGGPEPAAALVEALELVTTVDLAPGEVLLVARNARGELEVRRPVR